MNMLWHPDQGDVLWLDEAASVQFAGGNALALRVIRVRDDITTYEGWVWIDGYALNSAGRAVERRQVFVQRAGLHRPGSPGPAR
jgi:hypothetical protein